MSTSVQGAGQGRAIRRGVRTGLGELGGEPKLHWLVFASGSLQIVVTGYGTDSNVAWRAAVLRYNGGSRAQRGEVVLNVGGRAQWVHNGGGSCPTGGRAHWGVVPNGANGGGPDIRAPPSTSMSRQRATGWRPWHNKAELGSEYSSSPKATGCPYPV